MEKRDTDALNKVALRYRGVYLNVAKSDLLKQAYEPSVALIDMTRKLAEFGFTLSEELLHALALQSTDCLQRIVKHIADTMGDKLNWSPLVRNWLIPTNETRMDHVITALFNLPMFKGTVKGTTLPCGHLIPEGTFPLKRYTGCPFCGKPFETTDFVYKGQGSSLKELYLFNDTDMEDVFRKLLESPTPLDATQLDSLTTLLGCLELPAGVNVEIKENCMAIVEELVKQGKEKDATAFFKTPHDILRFLWYQHTGKTVVIRPATLIRTFRKWDGMFPDPSRYHFPINSQNAGMKKRRFIKDLKLKYNRTECRWAAHWLENLPMSPERMAENMHPYRGMWVRFIRALRLAEYARKPGYGKLAELMDIFYKGSYTTLNARLNAAMEAKDNEKALAILSSRPGLFARSLFSTMLHLGSRPTLEAFRKVTDKIPPRLILSLGNAAEMYFDTSHMRYVTPITGEKYPICHNELLKKLSSEEREKMVEAVGGLFEESLHQFFGKTPSGNRTIYIQPELFDIPVGVGDRTSTVQNTSCALMGTRFKVEGKRVRLFMQWGVGLYEQHLDMDLSCKIVYPDRVEDCAYYSLSPEGAKHSGDIREIPHLVGTAEYIELNLNKLQKNGAQYALFMCNAYSCGQLSPNLQVGWMSSQHKMKVSEKRGVAYDPSCVQHMVQISNNNLSKGLTFGVLDVQKAEITWLELPNQNQLAHICSTKDVLTLLDKLRKKCSVGKLLEIKAQAQGLEQVKIPGEADEAYTYRWALNPANVAALLG